MATSIVLSLDLRRPKDDNTYPIIFRITHNTKTTAIKSGYWVKESEWDTKKRSIKSSYKGTENPSRLNNHLIKKKSEMLDRITKLADKSQLKFMSLKQVKEKLVPTGKSGTFYIYTHRLIIELTKAKRIGTATSYKSLLSVIKAFTNQSDFTFDTLNLDFLNRFETYHLAKDGNGLNGLAVYMRTIRALYNKAIKDGVAEKEGYPFYDYKIRTSKTRKRAITLDAIKKILDVKLDNDSRLEYYRNIFLMSFYLQGMPFADMAHLKIENIIDGRIKYDRQKTDRPYDIKITPQLEGILKNFTVGKVKGSYLLPVIKREDPELQYKDIKWAIKRYNKNLKEIAKLSGIEENLTSYVARHSFASLADEMEIPVTGIRDMLGHQKVSTTEAYLSDLRKSKIDEYQGRVFNEL